MSVFNQDASKPVTIAGASHAVIRGHLTLIDTAYQVDDRATCTKMIEYLYAFFDQQFEATHD